MDVHPVGIEGVHAGDHHVKDLFLAAGLQLFETDHETLSVLLSDVGRKQIVQSGALFAVLKTDEVPEAKKILTADDKFVLFNRGIKGPAPPAVGHLPKIELPVGQPAVTQREPVAENAELGDEGVLVMLSDSTNAERPGFTKSERSVGAAFDEKFRAAQNRIIIASFSSNVHRLQQAIDSALKYGRKVAVIGRSMVNVVGIAIELGYLKVAEGLLIDISEINNYPPNQLVILTTGSQGEPMSALTRMAMSDHRKVEIVPGDTVLISATPIPGNEKLVARTVDFLFKQGADVIYESASGIHVSGHGSQEELKLMLNLVRPKFFIPVHGEYRMLKVHAKLALEIGIPKANIFIADNGSVLEFTEETGAVNGKVTAGIVLVDGLGVGDIGNIVMRDRRQLSQDGILIAVIAMDKESGCVVSGPEIVSRGFVYVRESEQLMEDARRKIQEALDRCEANGTTDWGTIKNSVRDILGKFLYEKTRRRPMIMPIILEV